MRSHNAWQRSFGNLANSISLAHASIHTSLTEGAGPTKIIKNVNLLAAKMKEKEEAELKEKAAAEAAARRQEEEAKRQVCYSTPT